MTTIQILVIDDRWGRDALAQREFVERAKQIESRQPRIELGFEFITSQRQEGNALVNDPNLAVETVASDPERWALVLMDMQFDFGELDADGEPQMSDPVYGLRIEHVLLERFPDLPLVRFTSTHEKDLNAAQRPYLSKFDQSADALRLALVQYGKFHDHEQAFQVKTALLRVPSDTVVHSDAMLKVYTDAYRFAQNDTPILIRGESGTGKEHLARYIHAVSRQPTDSFVPINLAAIPAELFETTLFGHEKGAFSGAATAREGVFTQAGDGTVFLDEIGATAPTHQAKLLRAIQERNYYKVGGSTEIKVKCAIVAATQDDIEAAAKEGTFRADLYNRFSQVLMLPPLRERPEEIPALANAILKSTQEKLHKTGIALTNEALHALQSHPLPKNARSVESAIERAVSRLASNSVIRVGDLGLEATTLVPNNTVPEANGTRATQTAGANAVAESLPIDALVSPSAYPTQSISPSQGNLLSLLQAICSQQVGYASPDLPGLIQHVDQALDHLHQEMAYAALRRCCHPVTGKVKIQPAMQLLTGDHALSAMNAKRILNSLLGKNQSSQVNTEELERELARRDGTTIEDT